MFSKNICHFPPLNNVGNEESRNGKHLLWTQVWCLLYVHADMHVCAHVNTTCRHTYVCTCECNTQTCMCVHIRVHTCTHAHLQSSRSSVLRFYNSSFLITPVSNNVTQKKPNSYSFYFPWVNLFWNLVLCFCQVDDYISSLVFQHPNVIAYFLLCTNTPQHSLKKCSCPALYTRQRL